ncbi:MAG: hypothetical protein M1347_06325 [Chloroflexi bacterium]|nr:hypothetical protein [Chloroflexota bacterium]
MLRDLRQYSKQTNLHLFAGFLFLLLVIGEGLIWTLYGAGAALFGLLCLFAAVLPIGFIWLILWLAELVLKRADHG